MKLKLRPRSDWPPPAPLWPCGACQGGIFWLRPADGAWECAVCHPPLPEWGAPMHYVRAYGEGPEWVDRLHQSLLRARAEWTARHPGMADAMAFAVAVADRAVRAVAAGTLAPGRALRRLEALFQGLAWATGWLPAGISGVPLMVLMALHLGGLPADPARAEAIARALQAHPHWARVPAQEREVRQAIYRALMAGATEAATERWVRWTHRFLEILREGES